MSVPNEDKDSRIKESPKITENQNLELVSVSENQINKNLKIKDVQLEQAGGRVISEGDDLSNQVVITKSAANNLKPEETQEKKNENSKNKLYNIFHFILFRNLYANVIVFGSTLMPKYKSFSKLVFFISLNMLVISTLCNFMSLDLSVNFFLTL